ncbi:MAG: hypothetical protein PWP38_1977 [Clostridiales bacterium]|jgi:Flp pilus assembly protein TadG|nr:hypothetical protein [Clostridiales bacterium]
MTLSDTIITGVVIVILLSFFVAFTDYTIPVMAKLDQNNICRDYATLLAAEGRLNAAETAALTSELTARGFESVVISVTAPEGLKFKDIIHFEVSAVFRSRQTTGLFSREEIEIPCRYEADMIYRKYVN